MKYLYIHPAFAGQHHHIIRHLAQNADNEIMFIAKSTNARSLGAMSAPIDNVKMLGYQVDEKGTQGITPEVARFEQDVIRAKATYQVCQLLKQRGFTPDVIWCHPSWGNALLIKEAYPEVPLICYAESYTERVEARMDPRLEIPKEIMVSNTIKNATTLLSLSQADAIIAPTEWQKSTFPPEYHNKIAVIHDGIDTKQLPSAQRTKDIRLPNGRTVKKEQPIITYVSRSFEAGRGIKQWMGALKHIQQASDNIQAIMIGGGGAGYGREHDIEALIKAHDLDSDRIHRVGRLEYQAFLQLISQTDIHVYLTVPTVLSWSCIEAMALGKPVVGSKTPPVEEVIASGKNGVLVDFFNPKDIANAVVTLLRDEEKRKKIGEEAKKIIEERYDLQKCLPQHVAFLKRIADNTAAQKRVATQ